MSWTEPQRVHIPFAGQRGWCGRKDKMVLPLFSIHLNFDHETWRYVALDDRYMMDEDRSFLMADENYQESKELDLTMIMLI